MGVTIWREKQSTFLMLLQNTTTNQEKQFDPSCDNFCPCNWRDTLQDPARSSQARHHETFLQEQLL